MFYDVTVGTSAAGISHSLHHSQLLHSMDLPHPYTLSLLRYVYPHLKLLKKLMRYIFDKYKLGWFDA